MNGWNDQIAFAVVVGEGVLLLALFVWVIALTSKFGKLKSAYRKLLGETGVTNLEAVMGTLHNRMAEIGERQSMQQSTIQQQERRLTAMKGRVSVHRFNAFADSGSDLSFSVAIVNDEQDGVVITGIHGREQTFLYAKPIDKGQSTYLLTPEEKIAINQATQKE